MKRHLASTALAPLLALPLLRDTTLHHPEAAAITWQTSRDDAMRIAARDGKGVFLLQMFGRLDDASC